MEILQSIKILSVPRWVKAFIFILLFTVGIINTIVFFFGIFEWNGDELIKVSIELLGVILPIIIVALLVSHSSTGVDALRRKTEEFFLSVLPETLSGIHEIRSKFYQASSSVELKERTRNPYIFTNLQKGECYADVITYLPHGNDHHLKLMIRLEINVRKINFNLILDKNIITSQYSLSHNNSSPSIDDISDFVINKFHHTTGGHKQKIVDEETEDYENEGENKETTSRLVYKINDTLLERVYGQDPYLCLVATCYVSSEFLWDPSEQLFFSQDLLFFLRSFTQECPACFSLIPNAHLDDEIKKTLTM